MKLFSKFLSSRWDLALIDENIQQIVANGRLHFIPVNNPFKNECWFADPFILDVTDTSIILLCEEMNRAIGKGRIAKITINRSTHTIVSYDIILEEQWHLSFPAIIRKNGKIYVYPESANSGVLYIYELIEAEGQTSLKRVAQICDDVVWDSVITEYFDTPYLFTAHHNDFQLDIYQWDTKSTHFLPKESIMSQEQNMRMAGDVFCLNNHYFIPSQISTPCYYGKGVELKELIYNDGHFDLTIIRKINYPCGLYNDGLHTFNSYKGVTIVDIHKQNYLLGVLVKKMINIKKKLLKLVK